MSKPRLSVNVLKCENSQVLWEKYIGFSIVTYYIQCGTLYSCTPKPKLLNSTKIIITNVHTVLYSKFEIWKFSQNFCYACVYSFSGTELNQTERLDLTRRVSNIMYLKKMIHNWIICIETTIHRQTN